MSLFQILLDAARASSASGPERVTELAEALRAHKGVDYKSLIASAKSQGSTLELDSDSPEVLDDLEVLADVAEAAKLVYDEEQAKAAERAARVEGLSKRLAEATEAAKTPASTAPIAEPVADVNVPIEAPALEGELVASANVIGGKLEIESDALPMNLPATINSERRHVLRAAADVPDVPAGAELDGMDALVAAARAKLAALGRKGSQHRQQGGIATIRRTSDPELTPQSENDWEAVWRANDESRLPGGSLLAAGAWCAPNEQLWDFCPVGVVDGLIDLPWVNVPRGSIKWPTSPDIGKLFDGSQQGIGWCALISASADASGKPKEVYVDPDGATKKVVFSDGKWYLSDNGTDPNPGTDPIVILQEGNTFGEKPCFEIPCGDEDGCTLTPCGICIKTGLLLQRAFPELVEHYLRNAMLAYSHIMNSRYIQGVAGLADQVTTVATIDKSTVAACFNDAGDTQLYNTYGPGATAAVLSMVELQVTYLRLKYMLGRNATVEMVAPWWLHGVLRADLSKRRAGGLLSVTNAEIDKLFTDRGVRIQWVADWQQASANADGVADPAGLGGTLPPNFWPGQVDLLFFPAGTIFAGRSEIITIDGIVDSVLLAENKRLAFFFEEAFCIKKRCYEVVRARVPICPNGAVGAAEKICCASGTVI